MWRSKKFILIAVLAATVLLVGGIGGVALAQAAGTDNTTPPGKTLLARVASILGIDQQKVENAFTQARQEAQEEALNNRLKSLVEQGKLTQQQADQYKAWLKSRPSLDQYQGQMQQWQQNRPGLPPEFKQWQEAMPDMPAGPGFPGGFRGFPGMGTRGGHMMFPR